MQHLISSRAKAALQLTYVADALSMPVHWFYNPLDILRLFPKGIQGFEPAPTFHPSSIMSLHSTSAGGRGAQGSVGAKEIVGDVILKGKRQYWGIPQQHYHRGLRAGENTLNACCARLLTRTLCENAGRYDENLFLQAYIRFMTADPPQHPDTYAESYHRGFFANLVKGVPANKCGAVTHDTPSIGGFVSIAPLAIAELLVDRSLQRVQSLCLEHLYLTHPDKNLGAICCAYVGLIDALLFRSPTEDAQLIIAAAAKQSAGVDVELLQRKKYSDHDIVGGRYSKACYIDDAWPSLLYLAYKYFDNPKAGLLANTNLGGENCHRGSVLGVILALASANGLTELFSQLATAAEIEHEVESLMKYSARIRA